MKAIANPNLMLILVAPECGVLQHPTSWQLVNASERIMVCNLCTLAWRRVYRWNHNEAAADEFVKQLRREYLPRKVL
jgi:hypothetical protein